jgi:Cu/Ag efflux protein CusF
VVSEMLALAVALALALAVVELSLTAALKVERRPATRYE